VLAQIVLVLDWWGVLDVLVCSCSRCNRVRASTRATRLATRRARRFQSRNGDQVAKMPEFHRRNSKLQMTDYK
jgi:hypothetical protein